LIVNRGEIARRINRTAHKMGIFTVALWTEGDRSLQFVAEADEAVPLQGNSIEDTYLNIDTLLAIAHNRGCDAIHPGYGFLSENPVFARRCIDSGITWVGPSPEAMELLSNKVSSGRLAASLGIPTIPTVTGSADELAARCEAMPYPLLIKAASGGGGRGMKIVRDRSELDRQLQAAAFEAQSYFGNATLFVTPYFERVRHVEVQIVADRWGNVVHLFDRECSIQRRYQKIVEEAPCLSIPQSVRERMMADAVTLARKAGYDNAGTVEYMVLPSGEYYFLEVNTRIQVEHPVTEQITGIDIVECQLRSARGEKLPWRQDDIHVHGHAIECRICAEDPAKQFLPAGGEILRFEVPDKPFVRLEADVTNGQDVNLDFDSLLAKIIVYGTDRQQAIQRMAETLNHTLLQGCASNLALLRSVFNHNDFRQNNIYTAWLEQQLSQLLKHIEAEYRLKHIEAVLLGTAAFVHHEHRTPNLTTAYARWYGRWRLLPQLILHIDGQEFKLQYHYRPSRDTMVVKCNDQQYQIGFIGEADQPHCFTAGIIPPGQSSETERYEVYYSLDSAGRLFIETNGKTAEVGILYRFLNTKEHRWLRPETALHPSSDENSIVAPIPGKVAKIFIAEGQQVQPGDLLAIIESMKTENKLTAIKEGVVEGILVKAGETVKANQTLFVISTN